MRGVLSSRPVVPLIDKDHVSSSPPSLIVAKGLYIPVGTAESIVSYRDSLNNTDSYREQLQKITRPCN